MAHRILTWWRTRTAQWLFRLRDSEPGEVYLHRRRVYIVPTRAGFGFAVLVLALLIGATNYSLGLGFGLCFLVVGLALVDMVATFQNLAYLHLQPGRARPVFAGEEAQFELLLLNRTGRARHALWVDFQAAGAPRHSCDVDAHSRTSVLLGWPSTARGWLAAPRVRLATRFPLGLFNAWSYWQPELKALVYPFPERAAPPLPVSGTGLRSEHGAGGDEEFAGVRHYQPGDPLRQLAWRQIARVDPALGGALVSKRFEGGAGTELRLDFQQLPSELDLELRLSRMTRWVLEAEQRGLPYGFRLGALDLPAGLGEAHQAACLAALALHTEARCAPG
ncbi:DUF58 domain-containing protein [Massilia sp. TS11]|uniref:DUF58 domain-containing protein n=1 Tax=Massilia sp. TS11 TaxID=2908003 RepID=UPI001ED9F837|nr:DUF58 domain-containing protein [Massilia sp. TS11]MCG2585571.1 DUF58 domain-containing protein [Massilia sp. TS11]